MTRHPFMERLRVCWADPRQISEEEWLAFAGHLSRDCRRCWSAVEQLAASEMGRPSDPLFEALYHVGSPGSWITLSSDLFEAVVGARARPYGFVFVLLEEALELTWYSDAADLRPLRKVCRLIWELGGSERYRRRLRDLEVVALAHLGRVHAWRRDRPSAEAAQKKAAIVRYGGTKSVQVGVCLLESLAATDWAFGYYAQAENTLRSAIRLLGGGYPMRRFELWASLAQLAVEAGGNDRLDEALAGADAALSPFLSSSDPSVRLRGVFQRGRLAACLGSLAARGADLDPEQELFRGSARVAVKAMKGHRAMMVDHTDLPTQALWLLIQARLASLSDPRPAEPALKEEVKAPADGHIVGRALVELAAVRSRPPELIGA